MVTAISTERSEMVWETGNPDGIPGFAEMECFEGETAIKVQNLYNDFVKQRPDVYYRCLHFVASRNTFLLTVFWGKK